MHRSWTRTGSLVAALTLGFVLAGAGAAAASSPSVTVDVALDHRTLLAGERQTSYLRVGLVGAALDGRTYRAPLNLAIVIDSSGSMAGRKIEQAKAAAIAAVGQLRPNDIVSVLSYDTTVRVLVPATKVSDRSAVIRGIRRLRADGSTALFAGTVKGAAEVRKFLSRSRLNRVVLLSDGIANVGPSSPSELAELGARLREEGISVTTIGIGVDYNEDLMVGLARASGAPFTFVEDERELDHLFTYGLGGLQSVVASDVRVTIRFADGFRPLRCFGRTTEILGSTVRVPLAQLYGGHPEEVLCAFETPPVSESSQTIADVEVAYHWLPAGEGRSARSSASAEFSLSRPAVEASADPAVKVSVVQRLADEEALAAMRLRDEGRLDDARRQLEAAQDRLDAAATRYRSEKLKQQRDDMKRDEESLRDPAEWKKQRKHMQRRTLRMQDDFL
jgi:Ca-activated chloride channel family protein